MAMAASRASGSMPTVRATRSHIVMSSRLSTKLSWLGASETLHRIRFRELRKHLYTGMMPAVDPPARVHRPTECARSACGKTLPPAKAVGRPRLYCSATCEQLAHREQRISRLAERRAQQLTAERTSDLEAEMTQLRTERDAAIRARDATLAGARSLVGHGNIAVARLQEKLDEAATMAKRNAASLPPDVRDLVNVLATIFTRWKADLGELISYVAQFDHRPATGDPDRDSHGPSPR